MAAAACAVIHSGTSAIVPSGCSITSMVTPGTSDAAPRRLGSRSGDERGSGSSHPAPGIGQHVSVSPGTGKSHLATALAVEAVRAGKSVYFIPLADLVAVLAKAEREGTLREKIRFLCRCSLLVVDEIGYLPVTSGGGNLFFQLVNARYEKGAMILTSNRGFAEWGDVFGDPVVATALLDRLLHHAVVVQIEGSSYRMRQHADLVPEHVRSSSPLHPPPAPKRRGRPGNVHSAADWRNVLEPVVVRYRGTVKRRYFRGDAAFANPEIYEFLEAESYGYAIRLPTNPVLQGKIGYLLSRPVGRPPLEVRRYYASFHYQAGSWSKPRRVVAKVEWHPGELYPRSASSSLTCRALPRASSPSIISAAPASSTSREARTRSSGPACRAAPSPSRLNSGG